MKSNSLFILLFALAWFAAPAFAHDPYEITSTIRIETNRTAVEIEMEFNTAMLLVDVPRSREPAEQAALFQSKFSELQQQAARFFEIASAGGTFVPTGTNVTLGVENHVKFNLEFPRMHNGLKLNATGLKTFSGQGPYGTAVTVLDMVNQKVLGQSVLFAATPTAEFAPIVPTTNVVTASAVTNAPVVSRVAAPSISAPPKPRGGRESVWNFVALGFFGVVLLVLVRRWRASGGSQ